MRGFADDPLGKYMLHPPRPRATVRVLMSKTTKITHDLTRVQKVSEEIVNEPVTLILDEGIYVGDPHASTYRSWFVPWEDVLESTIPQSMLPAGHPLA